MPSEAGGWKPRACQPWPSSSQGSRDLPSSESGCRPGCGPPWLARGHPRGTHSPAPGPPPGLSAVQPAGVRSNSQCPLHSHRGLASTESASGTRDAGERHRSQPSSRPSADIHQRLIYQPPRQPLGLTISATGWLPGAPLAPRSSGVVGGGAHSASQQARGPIPAHMGELHGSHSRPVEEPKAQRPLGPGAAPASA